MLIEGVEINSEKKDNCYLPFFSQEAGRFKPSTDWKIGAILMQKYYWVFDATPSTEHGLHYNRIGFGLEDHSKEGEEIGIFEKYKLLFVCIIVVILVLFILGCIVLSCA